MDFAMAMRGIGLLITLFVATSLRAADDPIREGATAPDAQLQMLSGDTTSLSQLTAGKTTVVVFLRGYPGYQCPICSRQVADLLRRADVLTREGRQVLLVYPGEDPSLRGKARQFFRDFELPEGFRVVLDRGLELSTLYGLRWRAGRETVYPTTLVLSPQREVLFRRTSRSRGGRVAAEVLVDFLGR
jgi:peroxiredoxin